MRRHAGAALVVLVGLLTSCGGPDQPAASVAPTPESGIPLYQANPVSDGAFLEAKLVLDRECLYLEAHGDRWLAIWPAPGTSWNLVAVNVLGSVVPVGAQASFGGGETDLAPADVGSYEFVNNPRPECLVGKAWWVSTILIGV